MSNQLSSNQSIFPGGFITSNNGFYTLIYQSDGNLVLYKKYYDGTSTALWDSGTYGRPGKSCIMQQDGNLVIYDANSNPLWSTDTWQHPGGRLIVQDDGNVVIYNAVNTPVWATNTWQQSVPDGPVATGDTMHPGQVLHANDRINSYSGSYTFIYQGDGNLVLYRNYRDGSSRALWASDTYGRPGQLCVMQGDGNLVIYDKDGNPLWSTDTWQHSGSRLIVQDDGNVVIYNPGNTAVWATNTWQQSVPEGAVASGDTMQPGQVLHPNDRINSHNGLYTFIYQSDGNLVLYKNHTESGASALWASNTYGQPGQVCIMQADGNLVIYDRDGNPIWSSDTWQHPGSKLIVQDDGNAVIYRTDNTAVWTTDTIQRNIIDELADKIPPGRVSPEYVLINESYEDNSPDGGYPLRKLPFAVKFPGKIKVNATFTVKTEHLQNPEGHNLGGHNLGGQNLGGQTLGGQNLGGQTPHKPFDLNTRPLDYKLLDPFGNVYARDIITWEDLDKYRDGRGFIKEGWMLEIKEVKFIRSDSMILMGQEVRLTFIETIDMASAPALVDTRDIVSSFKEYKFDLYRIGRLKAYVEVLNQTGPLPATTIKLIKPDGSDYIIRPGLKLDADIKLSDLKWSRGPMNERKPWKLRVEGNIGNCKVYAQVYDTLRIPAHLITERFKTLFGENGQNITFTANWDATLMKNKFGYVIHDKRLMETFLLYDLVDNKYELGGNHTFTKSSLTVEKGVKVNLGVFGEIDTNFTFQCKCQDIQITSLQVDVGLSSERRAVEYIVFPAGLPAISATGKIINGIDVEVNSRAAGRIALQDFAFDITLQTSNRVVDARCWFSFDRLIFTGDGPVTSELVQKLIEGKLYPVINKLISIVLQRVFDVMLGGYFEMTSIRLKDGTLEIEYVAGTLKERLPNKHYVAADPITGLGGSAMRNDSWNAHILKDTEKIKHIVVLMMENRSFDHVLGYLSLIDDMHSTPLKPQVNGLTPDIVKKYSVDDNDDDNVVDYRIRPMSEAGFPSNSAGLKTKLPLHVGHTYEDVRQQLNKGGMNGFVANFDLRNHHHFLESGCSKEDVLGYYRENELPMFKYFADEYAICDNYFCSHPGPTLPNRYYLLTGDLNINRNGEFRINNDVNSSLYLSRELNIFDILTTHDVSWRVYESFPSVTMLRMFTRYAGDNTNIKDVASLKDDISRGDFPSVVFIEPAMHVAPVNDDHPPADMLNGQYFIKDIYEALRSKSDIWDHTLFIITYDEHGGLFDHVVPPIGEKYMDPRWQTAGENELVSEVHTSPNPSTNPILGGTAVLAEVELDPHPERIVNEPPMKHVDVQYGLRVPTFVISPYVERGKVFKKTLDHTSIAKTILLRFCGDAKPFLSDRTNTAESFEEILNPVKRDIQTKPPGLPELDDFSLNIARTIPEDFPIMTKEKMNSEESDFHDFMSFLGRMTKPY